MTLSRQYFRCAGPTAVIAAFFLTACVGDSQFSDLDKLMAESRERPQGQIEPLPTYPPAEALITVLWQCAAPSSLRQ